MGHYYQPDGTAAHFMGSGGSPTTLREARKHGLVPSVTEVLGILAKRQLEEWKRKQTFLAAIRLPDEDRARLLRMSERVEADEAPEPSDGAWFKAVWRQVEREASRIAQDAAAEGQAIHEAIEASFASKPYPSRFRPHVSAVHQTLSDNFGGVPDWEVECSFAHSSGFGGKMDIRSRSLCVIGDHKGVAVAPDEEKKLDYDQHWQLGGYAEGIDMPESCRGFNLFISRTHPGHVRFHEWAPEKMAQGREVFRCALKTWQAIKGFRP
jgi:hypothetical protein